MVCIYHGLKVVFKTHTIWHHWDTRSWLRYRHSSLSPIHSTPTQLAEVLAFITVPHPLHTHTVGWGTGIHHCPPSTPHPHSWLRYWHSPLSPINSTPTQLAEVLAFITVPHPLHTHTVGWGTGIHHCPPSTPHPHSWLRCRHSSLSPINSTPTQLAEVLAFITVAHQLYTHTVGWGTGIHHCPPSTPHPHSWLRYWHSSLSPIHSTPTRLAEVPAFMHAWHFLQNMGRFLSSTLVNFINSLNIPSSSQWHNHESVSVSRNDV